MTNYNYKDGIFDNSVIAAMDMYGFTPLQGLIINHLTDPNTKYTDESISDICMKVLGIGSKRSVRRVKKDYGRIINDILEERNLIKKIEEKDLIKKIEVVPIEEKKIEAPIEEFWDITDEFDCVKKCSKVPEQAFVNLSSVVRHKIRLFMKWAKNDEWLAYLVGYFMSEKEVDIYDLVLPNQKATATLVSNVCLENYNSLSIIGVIHSHHNMGHGNEDRPSFSGHDENFINSNHNVSILVSKDGCAGHVRLKTPCGSFIRIKAKIKEMNEVNIDEKLLKEEFNSKINPKEVGFMRDE